MSMTLKRNPLTRYVKDFFTVKNVRRKFPLIEWVPKYRFKHFIGDLVAGLTVGLTVIPQGLAYALVAELPPQYGLYSAFMGVFMYTFLGTSKDITLGPTAIMSLLIAEFASERSPIEHDPTYALIMTLVCGLVQFFMGLLNIGFVVQFISFPVVSGFTSAAAVVIAFGQVRKWLGLKGVPRSFIPQVEQTFKKLPDTNLQDFGMGLGCLIILILMKKLKEKVDARMKVETNKGKKAGLKFVWLLCTARNAVIVVLTAGIASIMYDLYGLRGLSLTGDIDAGMKVPAIPKFYLEVNGTVIRTTSQVFSDIGEGFIVVTMIGILESIAIAKAFARRNEYKIDASQELVAIGAANIVSSFFHSYPVTGSFSRTAINSQSGVRTPAGGIWTGALVILAIVVLTPYFFYIPQAALAAVIIAAVIQMVEYDVVIELWKVKKLDLLPLFITFFVSVLANFEYGIMAGIGFSMLLVLFPLARPGLKVTYVMPSNENIADQQSRQGAVVLEPRSGLKFPGIEYMKDKIMKHGVYEEPAQHIVLNAAHFSGGDFTMVQGMTQISEYFAKHKLTLIVAECPNDIRELFDDAHIKALKYSPTVQQALEEILGDSFRYVESPEYNETTDVAAEAAEDSNGNVYDNPTFEDEKEGRNEDASTKI